MKLTKSQSLSLALLLLALFFGTSMMLLNSKKQLRLSHTRNASESAQPSPVEEAQSSSDVAMRQFERSEIKNGRKVWEIRATRGTYLTGQNAAKIVDADLVVYRPNDEVIKIKAGEALLHLNGTTMASAELSKDVKVDYNQNLTIETPSAVYNKEQDLVTSEAHVTITHRAGTVEGDGLRAELSSRVITLFHNVRTVINPQEKK